jgi:hypothetical protein
MDALKALNNQVPGAAASNPNLVDAGGGYNLNLG